VSFVMRNLSGHMRWLKVIQG